MKTMTTVVVVMLMALMAVPAQGDDTQPSKAFFEAAIAQEIADGHQKSGLRSSRSPNLRMKGHREASKAMFLKTHRAQLVESMVVLNIEPKAYKVQRFLNDRFSCTCYAKWTPQDSI